MADSEKRTAKKDKKRKQKSTGETSTAPSSKKHRAPRPEQQSEPERVTEGEECKVYEPIVANPEFDEGLPWKNLELILSIENKDLDLHKKVELAFDFVTSEAKERNGDRDVCETVKMSLLVNFLNHWVQSLLTSSAKKIRIGGEKPDIQVSGTCLDFRCWKIFKFCLESSSKLQLSLTLHKDILLSIRSIAEYTLMELNDMSSNDVESHFEGNGFELHRTTLDCISLVFSSHRGLSNENLELWLSTVVPVLDLVHKIHVKSLENGNIGLYVLQLSCLIFDPFAKFLRANPTYKKNGFHNFLYKLLEPLLHLVGVLHHHVDGGFPDWKRKLLNLIEDVLSYGLFHPVQIDGFFGLNSTEKYVADPDENKIDSKTVIKSYHRHLFAKWKEIIASKNQLSACSVGKLFSLFVARVKNLKGALAVNENAEMTEKADSGKHSEGVTNHSSKTVYESLDMALKESKSSTHLTTDKRKSLFDIFVLFIEPLLLETNGYLQLEHRVGPVLSDVHCTLRAINSLLASLMHEKIYLRTEDTSGGACINFLKKVYDIIMSLSSTLIRSSRSNDLGRKDMEMLALSAKEVLASVGYLLEIEYEVIGSDLTSLWLMMLSYLSLELSFTHVDQSTLLYKIADLGGQLFNLYSQLRQVNNAIFTLCKGIRLLISHDGNGDANYTSHQEAYAKSVGMLLCSEEFKFSIQNAIKSIPEGQASFCLQQLITDISESLKWIKVGDLATDEKKFGKSKSGNRFDLQAELLGRGLSEVYALVLNSLTVTSGNSTVVGMHVKDLITLLCPCMNSLVELQPDISKFLFSVMENPTFNEQDGNKNDLKDFGVSSHWIFGCFFQLYMFCRVLYRQAASLMPPVSSRKISEAMGDSFMAFSGRDWTQRTDWSNDGYFSCFLQPSASLLDVIQAVSSIFVQESDADCSPLIYVIHAMALQRLVDLNRQIKSVEHLLQNNDCLVQIGLLDDDDSSRYHRKNKRLKKRISVLRQEAAGLTDFMMESLSLVSKNQQPISVLDNAGSKESSAGENDEWDFTISSLNKKSLPTAFWWILCQNLDVWSIHAAKKKLKMFLSLLIRTSIPFGKSGSGQVEKHEGDKSNQLNRVTMWKISLELFNNSILYEQTFVRRHLASMFCCALEESALPFISSSSGKIDFESSPNWPEVLGDLENLSTTITKPKNTIESDEEPKASSPIKMELAASQSLLNLLSWIPKGFFDSKSFSLLLTFILNLERVVIGSLLNCQHTLNSSLYELVRLFLSCRKVLKYIIIASCEDTTEASQTTVNHMYSGKSYPVIWLFKSLLMVAGIQRLITKDVQVDQIVFSLLDHTLYVFLTLNKCHLNHAVQSISSVQKPITDQEIAGVDDEQRGSIESDQRLIFCSSVKVWKIVSHVAKSLREQMQGSVTLLKDDIYDEKVGIGANTENLNMFSSTIACFSGFLWGLVSVMKQKDVRSVDHIVILSGWKDKLNSEINLCIKVFEEISNLLLGMFLVNDSHCFQKQSKDINLTGLAELLDKNNGRKLDISCGKKHESDGAAITCVAGLDNNDSGVVSECPQESNSTGSKSAPSFLTGVDSLEELPLSKPFLRRLLKGDCPEAAFLLRELFLASSAILGLNLHVNCALLSARLMQTFAGISQFLLLELVDMVDTPQSLSFVWLDGVIKYLEELGNHFPMTDPALSRNLYVKIAELQLRAIGKCISFQGKRATLASREIESTTKLLRGHSGLSEVSLPCEPEGLEEFKSRLRLSFTAFIKKSSELHLLSAIQAIERALVGVGEKSAMIYNIQTGGTNGGKVSSLVAAGVDCLDLVLEFVSGRKRLNVVKRHIQSLIAGVFSIVLHLQSPTIFYERSIGDADPDPGAVILMCIEVLIRISGKHALFQMEAWHVAQSLSIPGALFQDFHLLTCSKTSTQSSSSTISSDLISDLVIRNKQLCGIDRRFSIDLYAACCRLLYNVLKHHKSELKRCIAVLEASVSVLLHCLETMDSDSIVRNGRFSWEVEEGVKCAYCLRRIYEEIRHQKDVLGRHCSQFLSNYIWVYSGYGPLKTGIKREIDEALRPGVYALIDASSPADLQHLHTVFGEGPCRNTLGSLQHDYKLNFQYEGKV